MLRSGDVQHERHAVDAAARDVGRAMDDARVVEQAVAMARLAAPLEERHVVVAQGARTLRVRALATERRARRLRGHPLRARTAVGRDQPKGDAVLVRARVRVRVRV